MIPVIVIPVLNRYDLLQRNLDSWDYPVGHLVVINNGKELFPAESKAARTTVIHSPTNLGVGVSWNLGIKMTPHAAGWLLMNSDAWFAPRTMGAFFADCDRDSITLSHGEPKWCCAWVGDLIVEKHGLFSECYVPAYFEDVDYERRVFNQKGKIKFSEVVVNHDNASTASADPRLVGEHRRTFPANKTLHLDRWREGIPEVGAWDLRRRRELGWDDSL